MKRISYQIIIGTILLILGVLLLLRAAGIYDTGQLLVYIPSLIVLFAVIALIKSGFRSVSGPLILMSSSAQSSSFSSGKPRLM